MSSLPAQPADPNPPAEPADHVAPEPRKRRQPPHPRYQPNLTPLIDVLFMLLLFFLLSTRPRQMEGDIPGSLPKLGTGTEFVDSAVPPIDKEITIRLRPVGAYDEGVIYEINDGMFSLQTPKELHDQLAKFKKSWTAKTPVKIKPEVGVRWKYVVEAFNQAVREQFEQVGFASAG